MQFPSIIDKNYTVCVCVCETAIGGGDHIISMIEGGGSKGRLIVSVNGQQGVICDHNATNAIAMVVCNELGLNTSVNIFVACCF